MSISVSLFNFRWDPYRSLRTPCQPCFIPWSDSPGLPGFSFPGKRPPCWAPLKRLPGATAAFLLAANQDTPPLGEFSSLPWCTNSSVIHPKKAIAHLQSSILQTLIKHMVSKAHHTNIDKFLPSWNLQSNKTCIKKSNEVLPWLLWLSWLEPHPVHRGFGGPTPSQGTYLGCRFVPG